MLTKHEKLNEYKQSFVLKMQISAVVLIQFVENITDSHEQDI